MYTLRPFEKNEQDYETIVAIRNAERPDEPTTVELMKFSDERRPDKFTFQRDLILHNGKIIARGLYRQNETIHKANKFGFGLVVHPDHPDQQGVSQFYLDHVLAQLADKKLDGLVIETREDRPERVKFLEDNGFTQTMRYPISALDVDNFDFDQYEDKIQAMLDSGIEIVSVAQMQKEDPDTWQKIYYDLDCELAQDVPMPDEYVPDPIEVFGRYVFENPLFIPEGAFFAREGERYVGMSDLWKDAGNDKRLNIGLTGVVRSHRRRGLATILKVYATRFAKEYGAKTIKTDNEENNPMYDLNVQLGYTPKPAYLDYEKSLK